MSYTTVDKRFDANANLEHGLMNRRDIVNRRSDTINFYEYETAVVLDIILDEKHEIFKSGAPKIDTSSHPGQTSLTESEIDYSWIGRVKIRHTVSENGKRIETLSWAIPANGNEDYPLVNEIVYVTFYMGDYYYLKLNTRNFVNNNADLRYEKKFGLNTGLNYNGKISILRNDKIEDPYNDFKGSIGKYFVSNDNIRRIRRYEGDTVLESRFGQSIRMGAYFNDPTLDKGDSNSTIYSNNGGNPCLMIRNGQRKLNLNDPIEKNVGGLISEDINADGSSVQMTSGLVKSKWNRSTIQKSIFGESPEFIQFCKKGATNFKFPELSGDQIVVQSDRLIFSSRKNELFLFGKSRISATTDGELTLDSKEQMVLTSLREFHLNSPTIHLGDHNVISEPILLGTQSTKWLYDLIKWLKTHTHIYNHKHGISSGPDPIKTQQTPELVELQRLESLIPQLVSDRVFTSGRNTSPIKTKIKQTENPPITSYK